MKIRWLLALTFIASCASSSEHMKWTDTDQAFRTELLRLIPIETAMPTAKVIMEQNGFTVRESSGTFAGMPEGLAGKPFLYCDRERRAGLFISRRYQAALVIEDGKIVGIVATTGLVGP